MVAVTKLSQTEKTKKGQWNSEHFPFKVLKNSDLKTIRMQNYIFHIT